MFWTCWTIKQVECPSCSLPSLRHLLLPGSTAHTDSPETLKRWLVSSLDHGGGSVGGSVPLQSWQESSSSAASSGVESLMANTSTPPGPSSLDGLLLCLPCSVSLEWPSTRCTRPLDPFFRYHMSCCHSLKAMMHLSVSQWVNPSGGNGLVIMYNCWAILPVIVLVHFCA